MQCSLEIFPVINKKHGVVDIIFIKNMIAKA